MHSWQPKSEGGGHARALQTVAAMAGVENVMEAALVGAAKNIEKELDNEIERLDQMQDDDLEAIRKRRMAQMKKDAEDRVMWKRNGHGTLQHITEKDFFARAKGTQRMVAIFFRPGTSRYSADLNDHVAKIAEHHLETLFVTIDADKAPFLCEKLKIRVLPSLVLLKDSEIDKLLMGLGQLNPTGKSTTEEIEKRLFDLGILTDTNFGDNC